MLHEPRDFMISKSLIASYLLWISRVLQAWCCVQQCRVWNLHLSSHSISFLLLEDSRIFNKWYVQGSYFFNMIQCPRRGTLIATSWCIFCGSLLRDKTRFVTKNKSNLLSSTLWLNSPRRGIYCSFYVARITIARTRHGILLAMSWENKNVQFFILNHKA